MIWEKKDKECEKVPVSGKIFNFPKGEVKLKYVNYWQSNPRLEGKAEDYEDSEDKGTINEQILDLMFQPDNIRELANQIHKDGGLRLPIWVGEDEDGKLVVYDGNRRFSAILHLQKTTGEQKYNSIRAVLMDAPGLSYVQRLAISTANNTDGVKEWSPYAKAEMLSNIFVSKMSEVNDEKAALEYCKEAMPSQKSHAGIKAQIDSHRLINKHKLDNNTFSIVHEGYVKDKQRKLKDKIIVSDGGSEKELETLFVKTLKKAQRSENVNFNANQFRGKIKTIWKGSLEEDELSKSTWNDFKKGELHIDDAIDSFEAALLGGVERKKIDEFHEFVRKVRNQKKIISALYDDNKLRKKITNLENIIGTMLAGANNQERSK